MAGLRLEILQAASFEAKQCALDDGRDVGALGQCQIDAPFPTDLPAIVFGVFF
jgi:hypothetical protein